MESLLCIIDISGLDVQVFVTDDPGILLPSEQEAKGLDIDEDDKSFGRYMVDECKIWLDASLSPEALRSHLFHEMYEFILGYFNVQYDGGNEHEAFMRMSCVLWGACRRNQAILFGAEIEKALGRLREKAEDEHEEKG